MHRPDLHGAKSAGASMAGMIAPQSPTAERWETMWHYMQGGPGIFPRRPALLFHRRRFAKWPGRRHRHCGMPALSAERRLRRLGNTGDGPPARRRDQRHPLPGHGRDGPLPDVGKTRPCSAATCCRCWIRSWLKPSRLTSPSLRGGTAAAAIQGAPRARWIASLCSR